MVTRLAMLEPLERAAAEDFTRPPVRAATSFANPVIPRQSPRFGVTLISNNQSSRLVSGSCSGESDSTSRPAIVSNSASFSADALTVTKFFSQLNVNFIGMEHLSDGVLRYLNQKPITPLLHHSIETFLPTRTAGETSDRSGRIAGCRQSHTLTSRFAPLPCQKRILRLFLDHTPRSGTLADRSCPRREFPANPCLCKPGRSGLPKLFLYRRKSNIECRSQRWVR